MSYNKNEFHQDELNNEFDFGEFIETENDEALCEETFIHEDEYNRDAYVGLSERDEFELNEPEVTEKLSAAKPRKTLVQKTMQALKVWAMTIAVGAVIVTSPAAEKTGITNSGASKLTKPDGTPVIQQTHLHNFEDGWTDTVTATCVQEGQRALICKDCNQSVKLITLPKSTHKAGDWILESAGDCQTFGTEVKKCEYCGEVIDNRQIKNGNHSPGEWIVYKPATCLEDGEQVSVCTVCSQTVVTELLEATGHKESQWIVDLSADCETAGKEHKECTVCGEITRERITDMTGHSAAVTQVVAEATCTRTGLQYALCSHCGIELYTLTIPAKGHQPSDWIINSEPTCTVDGVRNKVCTVCQAVLVTESIAANHIPVTDEAVNATCTSTGLTEGSHCSVCNEIIIAQTVVPATGHTEITDAAVAPTCEDTGLTEGIHCSDCGVVITEQTTIAAIGHNYDAGVQTLAPDCVTEGVRTYTCQNDVSHIYEESIMPTGHTEIVDQAVEADCINDGLTEGVHCQICNEVLTAQMVIPATGHNEVIDPAVEATCESTGLTEGSHCDVCGIVFIEQTETEMKEHSWTQDTDNISQHICSVCGTSELHKENVVAEAVAATCTLPGAESHIQCPVCLYDISQPIETEPLGHDIIIDEAVAKDCTNDGLTEGSHCSRCDEATIPQETIPATGHTWEIILSEDTGEADTTIHQCTVCGESGEHSMSANDKGHACGDCGYAEAHIYIASEDNPQMHLCEKCEVIETHIPIIKYDPDGIEDYSVHICALCNKETEHNWSSTAETHECECGLVETHASAGYKADDDVHSCSACNTTAAHSWEAFMMEDGSLSPDVHQCSVCLYQTAHMWDPDKLSPNGHVCICGYAGPHTFSVESPTDEDICDVCGETWATINNW